MDFYISSVVFLLFFCGKDSKCISSTISIMKCEKQMNELSIFQKHTTLLHRVGQSILWIISPLMTLFFLVADMRLYTLPCRSVGRYVGPSVRRSVRPSVTFLNSGRFSHYCSCPTVRDWIAVYPALFLFKLVNCLFTITILLSLSLVGIEMNMYRTLE